MSKFKKRRSVVVNQNYRGFLLGRETLGTLDCLAHDMDVPASEVVACGLWLLSKIGRSGREVAVFTEWKDK